MAVSPTNFDNSMLFNRLKETNSPVYSAYLAALIILSLSLIASPNTSFAIPGDNLSFSFGAKKMKDDNIYRLGDTGQVKNVVASNASANDEMNIFSANIVAEASISQQELEFDFLVEDYQHEKNTNLDHTAGRIAASWDWRLGSDFDGRLLAGRTRSRNDFVDTSDYRLDLVDRDTWELIVGHQLGGGYRVEGSYRNDDVSHREADQSDDDSDATSWRLSAIHRSKSGNLFATDFNHTNVEQARDPDNVNAINEDFDENRIQLRFEYAISDISKVKAKAGYLFREYDAPQINDYSGSIAELQYDWTASAFLEVRIFGYRDLRAKREQNSDYYTDTGVGTNIAIKPSEKVLMSFELSNANHEYEFDSGQGGTTASRQDEEMQRRFEVTYVPNEHVKLFVIRDYFKRPSNERASFNVTVWEMGITLEL